MKQTIIMLSPLWSGIILGVFFTCVVFIIVGICKGLNKTFKDYNESDDIKRRN